MLNSEVEEGGSEGAWVCVCWGGGVQVLYKNRLISPASLVGCKPRSMENEEGGVDSPGLADSRHRVLMQPGGGGGDGGTCQSWRDFFFEAICLFAKKKKKSKNK